MTIATTMTTFRISLLLVLALRCVDADIVQLTSKEFYHHAFVNVLVDAVVDLRAVSEWNSSHIEGAIFLESLGSFGKANRVSTPADLAGCRYCAIVVYCASGRRAELALKNTSGWFSQSLQWSGNESMEW